MSERTKALQIQKGCNNNKQIYKLENIEYNRCVGNFRVSSVDYILELYLNYQKGFLPFSVPLQLHPNKLIEIFSMIESIGSKHRKAEEEKRQKK